MFHLIFEDFNSDLWFNHVQYVGENTSHVLFNIRILKTIGHGKNRLYKRKLEIATQSSYTWVKPMPKRWEFVLYIKSHVTLHTKADAQKVN